MWQPEPGWHPLPGGTGISTAGVWRTVLGGRPVVVKRLAAPTEHDPPELTDPRHFAYWRRAADVVISRIGLESAPGLRAPRLTSVEEDAEGITLVQDWVEDAANSGLFAAVAIGRFAGFPIGEHTWLAKGALRDQLSRVARRGGWPTLARTTVADVADHMWRRRSLLLDELDALPRVAQHGDPSPANLPGRDGDHVVAIDWGCLGVGPVGADLGLYMLHAREEFEPLLDAYMIGLPDGIATRQQAAHGARVTAVLTALTRAEWALSRVAGGEGALAGKYRHPAVAPHLRALQRQFPQMEALLEG